MKNTSRLSSKGQVTIPREIRAGLHLEAGDLVAYDLKDGKAILRRAEPFDAAYHSALSETVEEWGSVDDDKAFHDL
jgi:antitoxin PrlF